MEGNYSKKAAEQFKKGQKELSTGIFKWNPDYNSAVSNFEEAGKLYKSAKQWKECIDSYEQAIMCNEKLNDSWAVARNLEQIIQIQLDLEQKDDIESLVARVKKAGLFFKSTDSFTQSLALYQKLAKFLVKFQKQQIAIDLMLEALQDAYDSGKKYNKGETLNYCVELLVENQQYEKVIQIYTKEIDLNANTDSKVAITDYVLISIIMCILLGEEIRADSLLTKFASQVSGLFKTSEYTAASNLIDFYKDGQQEEFDNIVNRHPIKSLFPVNIVRNLRKVKVRQILGGMKNLGLESVKEGGNKNNNNNLFEEQKSDSNNNQQPAKDGLESYLL